MDVRVFFHVTTTADFILRAGFQDEPCGTTRWSTRFGFAGVTLVDVPPKLHADQQLLEVRLPYTAQVDAFEVIQDRRKATCRKWCVPAALLNDRGTVQVCHEDSAEPS